MINKKRKFLLFCLFALVFLIIGLSIYYIFGASSTSKLASSLVKIQSNLADITSAKLAGKTTTTAYQDIANLSVPSLLQDYQQAAVIWAYKVNVSADNLKTLKNLANQPGDFPLTLTDKQAQTFFQSAVKTVAGLKQSGLDAITNKDKSAMRIVAAKLLVQQHWLNGVLYSKKSSTASLNLINPVFAVPAIGPAEDVTCRLCSDSGIRWTKKLRKQYGCDTRCNTQPKQTDDTQTQKTQEKTQNDQNGSDNELEPFTYKDSPKRAVCVGNNNSSVFCVEDAVQSTNEIAVSAIGFADGTKILSIDQWGKNYEHLEGGLGVISQGETDKAPDSVKTNTSSGTLGINWDGEYDLIMPSTCKTSHADGEVTSYDATSSLKVIVKNNQLVGDGLGNSTTSTIDSSGHIKSSGINRLDNPPQRRYANNYYFYQSSGVVMLKGDGTMSGDGGYGSFVNCTYTFSGSR